MARESIRTTITLDRPVHERASLQASRQGTSLSAVLAAAVENELSEQDRLVESGELSRYDAGLPELPE